MLMKRAFVKKQLSCFPFRQAVIVNNVHSFNGVMTKPIILKRPILILIELSNLNLTLLQNQQLIHEILKELLKEQTKTPRVSILSAKYMSADKEVQESDILGTALVAPICQFHHRVKETHLGYVIDDKEEAHVVLKAQISECNDEFQHVPSNHPSIHLRLWQVTQCLLTQTPRRHRRKSCEEWGRLQM